MPFPAPRVNEIRVFVDPTMLRVVTLATLANVLLLAACGGPRVVPARGAGDAEVRSMLVAEARVADGRARALDPTRECPERRRGATFALRAAMRACDTARHTDDRDLAQRCSVASRGAREAQS